MYNTIIRLLVILSCFSQKSSSNDYIIDSNKKAVIKKSEAPKNIISNILEFGDYHCLIYKKPYHPDLSCLGFIKNKKMLLSINLGKAIHSVNKIERLNTNNLLITLGNKIIILDGSKMKGKLVNKTKNYNTDIFKSFLVDETILDSKIISENILLLVCPSKIYKFNISNGDKKIIYIDNHETEYFKSTDKKKKIQSFGKFTVVSSTNKLIIFDISKDFDRDDPVVFFKKIDCEGQIKDISYITHDNEIVCYNPELKIYKFIFNPNFFKDPLIHDSVEEIHFNNKNNIICGTSRLFDPFFHNGSYYIVVKFMKKDLVIKITDKVKKSTISLTATNY